MPRGSDLFILFVAVVPVLIGPAARAAPTDAYATCMQRADSTAGMRVCQQAGLANANRRLAAALAKTMAALPAGQRAKLEEAQQRWAEFRESDCRVFFGESSGTVAAVRAGTCLIERTESRIGEMAMFSHP